MAYVENMTIHDADSHVMEMPETILEFFEAKYRLQFERFAAEKLRVSPELKAMAARHDDADFCAEAQAQLMLRKNHLALGAFRK